MFVRALSRTEANKLLAFANNVLDTPMSQLNINDVNQIRTDLEAALTNIARGALFNEAPGYQPITLNGAKFSIEVSKVDYNSFLNSNATFITAARTSGNFELNLND